jgi:hypothetical protein
MSNVHVVFMEDENDDLYDIKYYHHECAVKEAFEFPAPEAIDYPVYCEVCEERIYDVPLTEYGEQYLQELLH